MPPRSVGDVFVDGHDGVQAAEQRPDAIGIELLAALLPEVAIDVLERPGGLVGPTAEQGVEDVRHRDDSRLERNLLSTHAARIARAVVALVVVQGDCRAVCR